MYTIAKQSVFKMKTSIRFDFGFVHFSHSARILLVCLLRVQCTCITESWYVMRTLRLLN